MPLRPTQSIADLSASSTASVLQMDAAPRPKASRPKASTKGEGADTSTSRDSLDLSYHLGVGFHPEMAHRDAQLATHRTQMRTAVRSCPNIGELKYLAAGIHLVKNQASQSCKQLGVSRDFTEGWEKYHDGCIEALSEVVARRVVLMGLSVEDTKATPSAPQAKPAEQAAKPAEQAAKAPSSKPKASPAEQAAKVEADLQKCTAAQAAAKEQVERCKSELIKISGQIRNAEEPLAKQLKGNAAIVKAQMDRYVHEQSQCQKKIATLRGKAMVLKSSVEA